MSCGKSQCGGRLTEAAKSGARRWVAEVKAVQAERGLSYKEALKVASERRKMENPAYMTTKDKYLEKLNQARKSGAAYRPSGKKNKRPVTFDAAQRILLQYYRDRSGQFVKSPLTAMRKNIGSCHKDPRKTLVACESGRSGLPVVTPECANSWKFRPGKNAVSASGPGQYDIKGLSNLCGKANKAARASSKLYNMSRMVRRKAL